MRGAVGSAPASADRGQSGKPCFGGKSCVDAAEKGECKVGSQPNGDKKSPWRGGNYFNTAKACQQFTNQWENVRAFEVLATLANPCPDGKFFLKGTKVTAHSPQGHQGAPR